MEFARMLNERRYDDAMTLMEQDLREAAVQSPERLTEAARSIVACRGFFANHAQQQESERCFRWIFAISSELAGSESPPAMAAAESISSIRGALDRVPEAIDLLERVFAHF